MNWIAAALSVAGTGAFRWDANTDTFEATEGLRRLLGLPPGAEIRSLDDFLGQLEAQDRPRLEHAIRRCGAGEPQLDEEFRALKTDDVRTWLRAQGAPDPADAGHRVVGICTNVTAQREVRERLAANARQAGESEARLQALLEASPLGIDIMDLQGNPVFYNPRAEELHGFPLANADRGVWAKAVHPDDRERVERTWYEAAAAGRAWEDRYRFVHPDGRVVWVSGRAAPIRMDGERIGFVGTLEDITELKEVEARLEESVRRERDARADAERRAHGEQALREAAAALTASGTSEQVIHEIARNAVIATNADGSFVERIDIGTDTVVIVAAEGTATAATGGRIPYPGSLARQVVEGKQTVIVKHLSEARHQLPVDLVRLHPDDSAVAIPLVNGGEPIGALVLIRDHAKCAFAPDELRRAHTFADLAALAFRRIHLLEDSEQRREEVERLMKSRGLLMRGFSHDVKNPLGAADGFLGLLIEGIPSELPEEHKAYVARARNAIAASLKLIEDLLSLARAEAGQLDIEWEPVDVRDAAREIGEQYSAQAKAKGLEMAIESPAKIPVIESDATRVRQILGNLFSNAVKYTDTGSVRVTVTVRTGHGTPGPGRWIATEVRDTGPGIPPEKQSLLFQEFARIDPDGKRGTGIGLSMSRLIARALGGDVTASSEPGQGSVFTLWLPCTRGSRITSCASMQ